MNTTVTLTHHDGIALLTIANPPVNALSAPVIAGLAQALPTDGGAGRPARQQEVAKWKKIAAEAKIELQ